MKQKHIAALLAITLGLFGTHRFYLGQRFVGALYFLAFWAGLGLTIEESNPVIMLLPIFVSLVDCAVFFAMPKEDFDKRYNRDASVTNEVFSAPTSSATYGKQFFSDFKAEGIQHFRAGDYTGAIAAFHGALELSPKDPAICFNLACCYSILGEPTRGIYYLNEALDNGFEDLDKINTHPALEFLRQQQAFQNLNIDVATVDTTLEEASAPPSATPEIPLQEPLLKLEDLKNRGILTEEEFEMQRIKMLQAK